MRILAGHPSELAGHERRLDGLHDARWQGTAAGKVAGAAPVVCAASAATVSMARCCGNSDSRFPFTRFRVPRWPWAGRAGAGILAEIRGRGLRRLAGNSVDGTLL